MSAVSHVTTFWKILTCIALVCSLLACGPMYGGPTGYTEADPPWTTKYGYSDKQIDEDEFSVSVTGSPQTSKRRVADIALLRAAHITQEQGNTHFVIASELIEELETQEMISAPIGGLMVWMPVGERSTDEPHAAIVFRLVTPGASPPEGSLNAAEVIREVEERLGSETP